MSGKTSLLFAVVLIPLPLWAGSIQDAAPTMTASLRMPTGAQVSLAYQALPWDRETFTMLQSMSEMPDTKQSRDYYTQYITSRLAELTTNVTLKAPSFTLAPGAYRIGFVAHGTAWSFVAGDQEGRRVEVPVPCETQAFETLHLALLLVPGASPDTIQLVVLYGPHTVTLGFLLTGEPVPVTETEPPLYKRYFGGLRGEEIVPATPSERSGDRRRWALPTPTPKRLRPDLAPRPRRGSPQ